MFCKVCYDAGRDGYDTHFVKDLDGNVTCTYLLNLKCRNCNSFGHTVKYCKKNVPFAFVVSVPVVMGVVVEKGKEISGMGMCMGMCEDSLCDLDCDDEIVWGVGLKSMIGCRWADIS